MHERLAGLVPQPVSVKPGRGLLQLTACPDVRPFGPVPGQEAERAVARVRSLLGRLPWPVPASLTRQCAVSIDGKLAAEAYRLAIRPDGIAIEAGGDAGAIYAAQTLRQLLPDDAWRAAPMPDTENWTLPCAQIADEPALAWRGAHIDVARHFFSKRELLGLVEALAALKLNRLHLHLTDDQGWRIESRSHPALHEVGSHRPRSQVSLNSEQPKVHDDIPHGGYYSLADLAEISGFAGERGMALVPEIDLPGHSTALLAALPELGAGPEPAGGYRVSTDWGILPNLLAPLPESMDVLREIFGELVTATRARYVHIGGDECLLDAWRIDRRIDAYRRARGLGTAEALHASFLRDIADMLAADYAARAVVWDEGLTSSATSSVRLRDDTVVMAWRGADVARQAARAGHDVIVTPVFPTYFDYYQERGSNEPVAIGGPVRLEDIAAFSPVPDDWPAQARERLIGTQFQVWTEYIPDARALEYMIFPRACALAEVAWSGGPVPFESGTGRPALRRRIEAHLRRLDAAGLEYRPLHGPLPRQQGGAGPRRHRPGYPVQDVVSHLARLTRDTAS